MEIINNKNNSLPQQVEENMQNIKLLAKYLKEAYNTQTSLTTSSVSIAISDTNADSDTTNGWLIDVNGLLFNITNGDGTNLLLEYYASIKGATGATGATGADGVDGTNAFYYNSYITGTTIDENDVYNPTGATLKVGDIVIDSEYNMAVITSIVGGVINVTIKVTSIINDSVNALNKVWSGNKSIKYADKGTFYTTTQPTLVDTYYQLATTDIANQIPDVTDLVIKVNDLVLYIDSNDKINEMYKITNVTASVITMEKVADVGGGQLYQHNIVIRETGDSSNNIWATLTIISNDSTPFGTCDDLRRWLTTNGFNNELSTFSTTRKFYQANGRCKNGGTDCIVIGVWNLSEYLQLDFSILSSSNTIDRYQISSLSLAITDTIITL